MQLELKDLKGKAFATLDLPEENLKALLKESLPAMPAAHLQEHDEVARLNDTIKAKDNEISALTAKVAELSDPAKEQERLMKIASTWKEEKYVKLGEALGFATARDLTPDEEAELAEDVPEQPAPQEPKVFLKLNKHIYEVK